MANPRLTLRRPATHGGEDLNLRWSYPLSAPRTAPAGGRLKPLPVNSINYHPNHINPTLQKHNINYLDATRNYRRFPFAMKERADPKFGMSEFLTVVWNKLNIDGGGGGGIAHFAINLHNLIFRIRVGLTSSLWLMDEIVKVGRNSYFHHFHSFLHFIWIFSFIKFVFCSQNICILLLNLQM